ncbi:MAG: MATE family efflux transporter [Paludibacteraceae bacterium]
MKKYIPYYIANLKLALPIVVAQLGQILVQLADNIMVGRWGGEDALPLAAVSFGGQVAMLFFLFALGISMGLTPIVGALVGRGQRENTHPWLFNGLILYLVAGVLLMLLQLAFQPLLYHLGQPREVVDASLTYYRIMAYSIPFVMVFATFKQFLEGIGNTWISMVVLLSANLLNVFFNWLFIYGACGCPEMGIEGAALATFLARAVGPLAIVLIFIATRWLRPYIQGWHLNMFSMREMKRLIFIGLPIAGQMFLEAFAFVFTGIMMGWFGTIAISANQIMNTMGNCVFQIVLAMGAATTIRVSHCYGARDYRKMVMSAKAALHMVIAWNILAAVGFVLLRNQIPLLFTSNAEVASLAGVLLVCAATYQFFDGIQNVSIGILRGIQDVKIIPYISFLAYIVLNLPVGYLLAFPCGLGPKGLILAYVVGLGATAVLCLLRIRHDVRKLQENE